MGVYPEPGNTRLGRAITRSRPGRVAGSQYTESLDVHLEGGRVGEIDLISPRGIESSEGLSPDGDGVPGLHLSRSMVQEVTHEKLSERRGEII